jgi:hypothetical protein
VQVGGSQSSWELPDGTLQRGKGPYQIQAGAKGDDECLLHSCLCCDLDVISLISCWCSRAPEFVGGFNSSYLPLG